MFTPDCRRLVPSLALLLLAAAAPGATAEFSQDELFSFAQQAYLKASNTGAQDFFGGSVAISGDTMVVGALGEESNATSVNGNQLDNSAGFSGAAYVFVRSGTTWSQQAYLKASNAGIDDSFGWSVAISGDTVVVGANSEASSASIVNGNQNDNSAYGAGAAYVFVRSGTTWSQQAYLKASNTGAGDSFGNSVDISGDTIVVGAFLEDSNATGVDNFNQLDNSAQSAGAAYVFVRSDTIWSQQAYLKASNTGVDDFFGRSVAISSDTIVVGAPGEDSNATSVNGNQFDNSADSSGAAYVFVRSGTTWAQQAFLKASNTEAVDSFGGDVAISGDASVIGAGGEDSNATGINGNQNDNSAPSAGAAYVFVRSGSTWSQQAYLKASNTEAGDFFGGAAISGEAIVVRAFREDSNATGINGNQGDNSATDSGAAYVFARTGSTWSQQAYLKASATGAGDFFGIAAAISGDTLVAAAGNEDSNATGVNGNQADNSATNSGAAYVFRFEEEDPPPPAGGWQQSSALPGFRFKVLIGGDRVGTQVADCVAETLCIAGAKPSRSELFVRIIGPRGNGKLWAQAVRFTVSQVELWIEQTGSGQVNYYLLEALPASTETLSGVNDSLAFDP